VSSKDRFSPFEFGLVICTAFGWSILISVYALILKTTVAESASQNAFGNTHLLGIVLYEAILTPVLLGILYARGWRLADLRPGVSVGATLLGFAIYLLAYFAGWAIDVVLGLIFPVVQSGLENIGAYQPSTGPAFASVVLASLVNPVYEEVFVSAYVIESLRPRFGVTTAVNVSVVIRASYHLYQGIPALPFHCAYGLLQGYVYVRYARLWPLIVSHALLDFVAFVQYI
jgi:membrane protease YdiL (CAAX protease family)